MFFVIDKLFPDDDRHGINKTFLGGMTGGSTSIFNLFELLGIASSNLNEVDLMKLFKGFGGAYDLEILYPTTSFISVNEFVESLFEEIFQRIRLKMNVPDALILAVVEQHHCTNFITWNTKHFVDRTYLIVQTPEELMESDLRD